MGWTSSGDMKQQVRLHFDTKEEAIAYCERNGIPYRGVRNQAAEAAADCPIRTISPIRAAEPGRTKTPRTAVKAASRMSLMKVA